MMQPYYDDGRGIVIYHGDCRDVLPTLEAGSVDAAITDPPYGVELDYEANFTDTFVHWCWLIEQTLPEMLRVSRGVVTIPTSKLEGEAYLYREHLPTWRICWHKGPGSARTPLGFKDWETIFIYGKPKGRQFHDYFCVRPTAVRRQVPGHPCPKPLGWATWLIDKCSHPGDLILDPFLGSGTTLVAAQQLGRRAIGIEIEERYCEIAARRLDQMVLPLAAV